MRHIPVVTPSTRPPRKLAAMGLRLCHHMERPAVGLVTAADMLRHDTLLVATGVGLIAILVVEVAADVVAIIVRKEEDK